MKRSIARKWAKALESGEYKQTKGALRKGDGACCLGVLCNLHAIEHPDFAATQKKKTFYAEEDAISPNVVCLWAGLNNGNPLVDEGKYGCGSLAELNDKGNLTFPEIAKIIRKHWKEL